MEKSRHKQFIGFTLCAVLRSKMKSWAILIQHMKDGNHPSVQGILPASHFVAIWVIRPTVEVSQCLCSSHSYLTAPKGKRSDAGNLEVPMRSCKVLPLMKRWKLSTSGKKKNRTYAQAAKIYGRNRSSVCEIVKKAKEIGAGFACCTAKCKGYGHSVCEALSWYGKGVMFVQQDILRERPYSYHFYYGILL